MKGSKIAMAISILSIITTITGCSNLDLKQVSGDIAIDNYNINNLQGKGIIIYSLNENKQNLVLEDAYYRSPSFNKDKSKIITVINSTNIVEYDFQSKSKKLIMVNDKTVPLSNIKYIPNSSAISYNVGIELYTFDILTGKKTFLLNAGNCSWSMDGKYFLYSNYRENSKINKYDMQTGKTEPLFDGYKPELSNNNEYIAYLKEAKKDTLVIREIATGKEWSYKANGIHYYRFSPDDKYVAIEQEHQFPNFRYIKGQEIKLWEFKENKVATLIKHIDSIMEFDWK